VQKVALGRGQFRLLLWGVTQRLAGLPPERRPRVLVFGESMGAWTSSDVVMFQGIEGFDHYGIDRALWVGLPWLAEVVAQRHDPGQQHPGPRGHRRGLRPPRPAGGAERTSSGHGCGR
jgi:uncharacterized membrane protein